MSQHSLPEHFPKKTGMPQERKTSHPESLESSRNHSKRPLYKSPKKQSLFWLCLILGGLFALLNGPLTRYVAQRAFDYALKRANVQGTGTLQGTFLRGFYLQDFSLKNYAQIKRLYAHRIIPQYRLRDLWDRRIQGLNIQGLHILLDVSKDPQSPPKEFSFDRLRLSPQIIEQIERHVIPLDIQLSQAHLTVASDQTVYWQGEGGELHHGSHSRFMHLSLRSLTDVDGHTFSPAPAKIFLGKKRLLLENIPLTNSLNAHASVQFASSQEKQTTPRFQPIYELSLQVGESVLQAISHDYHDLHLSLSHPPFQSSSLPRPLANQLPCEFSLTSLKGHIENLSLSPHHWKGMLNLSGHSLCVRERSFPYPFSINVHRSSPTHTQIDAQLMGTQETTALQGTLTTPLLKNSQLSNQALSRGTLDLSLQGSSIKWLLEQLRVPAPKSLNKQLTTWPDSPYQTTGSLNWEQGALTELKGEGILEGIQYEEDAPVPALLTYQWKFPSPSRDTHECTAHLHSSLNFSDKGLQILAFKGLFNRSPKKDYRLALVADLKNTELTRLAPLLKRHHLHHLPFTSLNMQLTSQGKRKMKNSHKTDITITKSVLKHPSGQFPPTALQGAFTIQNKAIHFKDIHLQQKDRSLQAQGSYKEQLLRLDQLTFSHGNNQLLKAVVRIPLDLKKTTLEDFKAHQGDLHAYVQAKDLPIKLLGSLIQKPLPVSGLLNSNLSIRGSLAQPKLRGDLSFDQFKVDTHTHVPPVNGDIQLHTQDESIHFTGRATASEQPPMTVQGRFPFHPWKWAQSPDSWRKEPLKLSLRGKQFDLSVLSPFLPVVRELKASSDLDLSISGSLSQPLFQGSSRLFLKHLVLESEQLPPITNTSLELSFNQSRVTIRPVTIQLLGGQYSGQGTLDLKTPRNPSLDLTIRSQQALLWRNNALSSRMNGAVNIRGSLEKSHVTGQVDIIETLYYRPIEILPIGVTTRTRKPPKLPTLSSAPTSSLPIPAPFRDWTLNLNVHTADPLLIRSNLAQADISGRLRLTGSLANPLVNGTLNLSKGEATLPFSRIKVAKGSVLFKGSNFANPRIELRGTSRINAHDINFALHGSLNNPQTVLSSNPPLPEHEILTLLATGITSSELEDQETASTKALQLLLERLRHNPPGGQSTALARFLQETRDIEFRIAETNPFTGKKHTTATIPLHERWFVSAAVDENKNTRGLLIYLLRFH